MHCLIWDLSIRVHALPQHATASLLLSSCAHRFQVGVPP
jgi:hypothetical protein